MTEQEALLLAMYRSVDRMNDAVVDGNTQRYQSERSLQTNIRQQFESLGPCPPRRIDGVDQAR